MISGLIEVNSFKNRLIIEVKFGDDSLSFTLENSQPFFFTPAITAVKLRGVSTH